MHGIKQIIELQCVWNKGIKEGRQRAPLLPTPLLSCYCCCCAPPPLMLLLPAPPLLVIIVVSCGRGRSLVIIGRCWLTLRIVVLVGDWWSSVLVVVVVIAVVVVVVVATVSCTYTTLACAPPGLRRVPRLAWVGRCNAQPSSQIQHVLEQS